MTGSGCVMLYCALFHSVCSLKEQFNISGIPGITHTCPESFFTSSFADTYRQCLRYCWMTTRCTACTWIPRSSVCRLHEGEYSVPPETPVNTSCLFSEASTKHLGKHHPCQGRPCDAAQTCAAVEAASSFICLSVPVAATTFATVSTTTAFDTADSTTTTPTTTTPTSTAAPATSTTAAAEVADVASTSTTTSAITTFAIATATTIVTTTTAAAAAVTAKSTTTTTTTSNTPTSTTPTTATSTTPTTTTLLISCSFEYMGCYLDDKNRMLKDFREESDVMTREWCLVKCREGNYTFAGLEHYRHCFCGDSHDESVYPKKAESECNTPCTGNPQQMCGGGWRLSVFICR